MFINLEYKPQDLKELAIHMKNGVMLCDLVHLITKEKMGTVYRKP